MTTFAKTLETTFKARRAAALAAANPQQDYGARIKAAGTAFAAFIDTEGYKALDAMLADGNTSTEMVISTETTGDSFNEFADVPAWQEFANEAARSNIYVYHTRLIRELSEAELRLPENMGCGRIGGKPVGVKICLRRTPQLLDAEGRLLGKLPSITRVMDDMTAEVEKRDPTSAGNVFSVNYDVPQMSPELYKLLSATISWRTFAASCRALGLEARLDNYNQRFSVGMTMRL